jgi:uncharacterized membrane protein (DUF2068 family)
MTQTAPQIGLVVIALFTLVKGLLLLLAGAGFLRLVDAEIDRVLSPLMDALHLNLHSRVLHALLLTIEALQRHAVLVMGFVSVSYASLLFVEGFGLWIEASWAAYLTVISTSILLPGEFHAVSREMSVMGMTVLAANVAIVIYLVRQLGMREMR